VLTFIIPSSLLWTVLVWPFVIDGGLFHHLLQTPGIDPARAIAGLNPIAQCACDQGAVRGHKPLSGPVTA